MHRRPNDPLSMPFNETNSMEAKIALVLKFETFCDKKIILNKAKRFANHTADQCLLASFFFISARSDKMQSGRHQKSYIALLSTASAKGGRQ